MEKSFQDHYPPSYRHCYGCGPDNVHGLQIKSYWEDGEHTIAVFQPKEYHQAFPGYVYGGLIASLIDCHSTGTAAAAAYRAEDRPHGSEPHMRFVTASLHVDYLQPTPLGPDLHIQGTIVEIKDRKVVVETKVIVDGEITAKGKVVAIKIPEHLVTDDTAGK